MVYDPDDLKKTDVSEGSVPASPRARFNRTASLTLTTSWQRLDFNGSSSLNVNTYPMSPDNSNRMVYYDTATKLFRFMTPVDRNYTVSLYLKTTAASLLNALNLTMASLQLRFIVPGGNADGTDYYFPFPAEDGLIDLTLVNSVSPWRQEYFSTIFADEKKRNKGVGIEVKLSNVVAGTITLTSSNILIYGR